MRVGVIDIGSRSIKLIIGEKSGDSFNILESLKNVVPIANDTFLGNRISQETINQAVNFLNKYKELLDEYEVSELKVIATTAVRESKNKDIFCDAVLRRTGMVVDVLTVGDIVYYIDAYLNHKLKESYPIHSKNLIIAELGSASLDISITEQGFTLMHTGLPLGVLRLKQLMSSLNGNMEQIFEGVTEYIENEFNQFENSLPKIEINDVIIVDENYSSFFQNILKTGRYEDKFFQINGEESRQILKNLADKTPREIGKDYKIPGESADTITAYAIILNIFFTLTSNDRVYILETSLAEAVLANILFELELSKKYNKSNQLISIAKSTCAKFKVDLKHAQYVAEISEMLFSGLREPLGLKKECLIYLLLSAWLHDIGMFIHNRSHHKHTEYIINSLNLSRLNAEEVKMIACIARYHRKALPNEAHLLYGSLPQDKQIIVQKLSSLLRIANSLDRSHKQKVKKVEVKINPKQNIILQAYAEGNLTLESEDFKNKKNLFEEITGNKITLSVKG
ncbi:MAG: HD domain-containing protein [Candidatus Omnitrophica bacterium]|nr:HD domain-containing protein [Candidatus Omnitrophota bacterium]MDD5500308.1 HD domain-containing protein [Candidatus Omnitrophota bacterium]